MACSKSSRQTEGLVTKALDLDIVIDKILEHLPISIAAQTSVLSKQWRRNWLSLKSLVFNKDFWYKLNKNNEASCTNECKWRNTISNILLYHKGPVDCFELYDYCYKEQEKDRMCYNPWLYFLSKNGIKKISIYNYYYGALDISPYIFCCSELVHLKLFGFSLCHPPTDFRGYRNLKHLELTCISFARENSFLSLFENCSMLAFLSLEFCDGIKHIVLDVPSLKTLIIKFLELESITFRNVHSLVYISLHLGMHRLETVELIDADNLANSCQLQSIEFCGTVRKLLAAGDILRSHPVTFNYLNKLRLLDLDYHYPGDFHYVLRMLQSCPCVTLLDISFIAHEDADQSELEYNYSHHPAHHLVEIKINAINGSRAELKLIEHLLAISIVLEKLFLKPRRNLDIESRLEMSIALHAFPRASTKARIVFLDK